jgi:hypothetical protein
MAALLVLLLRTDTPPWSSKGKSTAARRMMPAAVGSGWFPLCCCGAAPWMLSVEHHGLHTLRHVPCRLPLPMLLRSSTSSHNNNASAPWARAEPGRPHARGGGRPGV